MEILLLITIVIIAIAFINFKDYLSNPQKRQQFQTTIQDNQIQEEFQEYEDPYKNLSKESKIKKSQYGVMVGLLAKLAQSDGKICELEKELIENTIEDIAQSLTLQSAMNQKEEILEILHSIFQNTIESVEELSQAYADLTKGQYKSRLKLVEYLLALAYADKVLSENEREVILDVAAYLEIENDDFNKMYDAFVEFYSKEDIKQDYKEACKVLGVSEEADLKEIKTKYKALVREYHPDILHHKGLEESIIKTSTAKLQEINAAYEIIEQYKKEMGEK